MQKNETTAKTLTSERKYREALTFCAEHRIYCFEYYYRHRKADRKTKKAGDGMMDLKVIENELVSVYETDKGEKVVYGTELHAVLGVKSNYRDWIKNRLKDCDAVENEDFESFAKNLAKGGRPQTEYIIKLDTAKEMAMLERNSKGKQVRRYFIQIEKKYKAGSQPAGMDIQAQFDIFQKFIRMQTEFMEKQAEFNRSIAQRVTLIQNDFPQNSIADSSRMEKELDIREKKTYLYSLVEENAELRGIGVNSFLHVMYGEIEREFDVTLNSYRSVYRSEMRKPDAGMVEVVAANDRFYDLAVRLCKFMLKDYREQEALAEGMKKFNG